MNTDQTAHLLRSLERNLGLGLGVLYLVLLLLAWLVARWLSAEAARNAFLTGHDPLTGLPNRVTFARAAGETLLSDPGPGSRTAVAIVDLDRFTQINDTLSHRVGDGVLRELANRLRAELGPEDLLARLGGDEFGILLRGRELPPARLARLRATLGEELPVAGLTLRVQSTIGYALAPEDGRDIDQLLARADMALAHAGERRRPLARWGAGLQGESSANLSLATELRRAIEDDQLVLHYQPVVDPRDGAVRAFEALVRWAHPANGLLFPNRFLPLAEQTDDIERLTGWVLRRALRDLRTLAPEHDGPRIAVNVSARSLGRGGLAAEVLAALRESCVEPDRLIVEVTETAILLDPERAAEELAHLARAGVRVSLDDFGRGQTSIAHFSTLPLHELKIDRSFVSDMAADATHAAIVRSVVELGHNLALEVVVEGVEDETVRDLAALAGADLIQGYLLTRPLPLAELGAWLAARRSDRPWAELRARPRR